MEKISNQNYQKAISYLATCKKPNERVFFFPYVDCVVADDGHTVLIRDYSTSREKFYQEEALTIKELYIAVRNLYIHQVTIGLPHEDDFQDVEKLEFFYGPVPFTFQILREMVYAIEKAKFSYKK